MLAAKMTDQLREAQGTKTLLCHLQIRTVSFCLCFECKGIIIILIGEDTVSGRIQSHHQIMRGTDCHLIICSDIEGRNHAVLKQQMEGHKPDHKGKRSFQEIHSVLFGRK